MSTTADSLEPALSRVDTKKDYIDDTVDVPPILESQGPTFQVPRPPLDYSSAGAFVASLRRRFVSIWTKRFILSLLAGQLVSLCITCTNVTTTELVDRNWSLPTTQTWFLYFSIFTVYTPYTIYQYGFKGWLKMIYRDGWRYIILAACDVEGNFFGGQGIQLHDATFMRAA